MAQKPKIMHLIQSLDLGGCENFLLRLLPRLAKFDHIVITLAAFGSLAPQFEGRGIKVVSLRSRSLFDLMSLFRLRQSIVTYKPDLIFSYLFHADVVGRLFVQPFLGQRVIPCLRTTYNYPRYRWARRFEQVTHGLVSHYLANSEAVKAYYVNHLGVKAQAITVIPNGLDLKDFGKSKRPQIVKHALGLPPKALVITCVANLHPNKGHTYLLEAFEATGGQNKTSHLLIVGDGETAEQLHQQAATYRSKSRIHFLGRRDDVPSILSVTDIFVLPTLFEGMSNAILEAMASACAVIVTDIPENRVLITHQVNGLLVAPRDARGLGRAIGLLAQDSRLGRKLGVAARESVRQNYSLEKSAKEWEYFLTEKRVN